MNGKRTDVIWEFRGPLQEKRTPAKEKGAPVLSTQALNVWYGTHQALIDVNLDIPERQVTAIIGPSGCGKSTLLRSFNRLNELIPGARTSGRVLFRGENIYDSGLDPTEVRRWIGMVFQKPNPFPKTVFENVAFGLRIVGVRRKPLQEKVERALRLAALWDEVKDDLHKKTGYDLSGGQQQRLCIARALAVEPEVLLMDEPCSSLDPIATAKIEELIRELASTVTVVIVTHNLQQAARVSDFTAFMFLGKLVEFGKTHELFTRPKESHTAAYIMGRFG